MSANETEPVPVDPARDASAMLRACEYQIIQTVSAWLDLRGDEVLYVEGAEDFDTHSPIRAEAVQVKTSPKPISLGQKEIQETLNHYWKLRSKAAGRTVRFRFLTCATIACERGEPFGIDVAGIELWQRHPLLDGEARSIAKYLQDQPNLDSNLRIWLKGASPEQIRTEFVEGFIWQTHAEEVHFVERAVLSKLAVFGERRGTLPASVTKQVFQRLVEDVWKKLRDPAPRRLDFFRLEELWEETTRVSIPRTALDARWNDRAASPPSESVDLLRSCIPPLPGLVARRAKLVDVWCRVLSAKGLLNLHGSARTGKTTLAKLVSLSDADKWNWWSAARMSPEEIQRALRLLVLEVARLPANTNLILDDLDFSPTATQSIEEALGELLALVRSRQGRVLITSQKPLPRRLQHVFGVESKQVVSVPRLEVDEVTELAGALGCVDEMHRSAWSQLVLTRTAGHPQLAAVQLLALKDKGWPEPSVDTFNSGTEAIKDTLI